MNLKELMREDDAVSPVIGVILMVAITVILAAVIASFVLGMGPDTATTPSASFSSEEVEPTAGSYELEVTLDSGTTLDEGKVTLVESDGTSHNWEDIESSSDSDSEITAGQTASIPISGDYTVDLIYTDGDTSSTMQTFEGSV